MSQCGTPLLLFNDTSIITHASVRVILSVEVVPKTETDVERNRNKIRVREIETTNLGRVDNILSK